MGWIMFEYLVTTICYNLMQRSLVLIRTIWKLKLCKELVFLSPQYKTRGTNGNRNNSLSEIYPFELTFFLYMALLGNCRRERKVYSISQRGRSTLYLRIIYIRGEKTSIVLSQCAIKHFSILMTEVLIFNLLINLKSPLWNKYKISCT